MSFDLIVRNATLPDGRAGLDIGDARAGGSPRSSRRSPARPAAPIDASG